MNTKKKKVWNSRTQKQETEYKVAMALLRSGLVTVGEAARLRGVTRQAMQKYVGKFNPLRARRQHLKSMWQDLLNPTS